MSEPQEVSIQISELIVETRTPIDGFALQLALGDALASLVRERGLPPSWGHDVNIPAASIEGFAWAGEGRESGLARALAERLYTEAVR